MISATERNGNSTSREPLGWIAFVSATLFVCLLAIFLVSATFSGVDYLGPDNDDAMRLVVVRDFLAGRGWFDHMQYRLGLEPGTLMHWSRLVDLPIAALVRLAEIFTADSDTAEAIALFIWPVSLTFPLIFFVVLGGYRLGGKQAGAIAGVLAAIHAYTVYRFAPGAIDHHNVQMVLIATFAAAILDPGKRQSNAVLAGLAAAIALAIGAETTPLIATGAVAISLRWALTGETGTRFAGTFSLAFAVFTALIYVATIPPSQYFATTCDALSAGYLYLTVFGGLSLFAASLLLSNRSAGGRFVALAAMGLVASLLAFAVMPECLANPYANLDPLLKDIWLSTVIEAQSFLMQFERDPSLTGGNYAVGLLALFVCAVRIGRGQQRQSHIILAAFIGVAWLVTLVQLRGSAFANLIAIFPLALAISDLRTASRANDAAPTTQAAFIILALASLPASWFLAGTLTLGKGSELVPGTSPQASSTTCISEDNLIALNALPAGTIAATSNAGAPILRFTQHRVLSAPYHRNQVGMLAVIRAAIAPPAEALTILNKAGADYLVFCGSAAKEVELASRAPQGLYAKLLAKENVDGLQPITGGWSQTMSVYSINK